MSVQSDTSRIQYTGNGSAVTPYPVPFVFHEATHIRVVVTNEDGSEVELVRGTEYVIAGAGAKNGGNVTTKTAVSGSKKLTIFREVPEVQGATFKENDRLPSEAIERGLDKLTMICQQLARKVSRALRFSDSSPEVTPWEARKRDETGVMLLDSSGELQLWSMSRLKEELMIQAAIEPMLAAMMVQHPVGSLFFTIDPRNPRDILGFGTWVRYGSGRMIVSVDPTNTDFNASNKTGGEATHTLTVAELAKHSHTLAAHNAVETTPGGAHQHPIKVPQYTTPSGGGHTHNVPTRRQQGGGHGGIATGDDPANDTRATADGGAHTHTLDIPQFNTASGGAHSHTFDIPEQTTRETGNGAPHNNMPPYITAHVWMRINSDAPNNGVGTLPFPADPTLFVDRVTGETRRLVVDDTVIGTVPVS